MSMLTDSVLEDLNSTETIASLEAEVNGIFNSIEDLEIQKINVENAFAIVGSEEDNALTQSTVDMLTQSLESSVASLGLPLSILNTSTEKYELSTDVKYTDEPIKQAKKKKEGFVKKIVAAIKKMYVKLSTFIRKMFLKIITTLNFNKKTLDVLLNGIGKIKKEANYYNYIEDAQRIGKMFGTLNILSGNKEKFYGEDLVEMLKFTSGTLNTEIINNAAKYLKDKVGNENYSDITNNAIIVGNTLEALRGVSNKGKALFNKTSLSDFNFSKDEQTILDGNVEVNYLRYDGLSVTVLVIPLDNKVENFKIMSAGVKKEFTKKVDTDVGLTNGKKIKRKLSKMDAKTLPSVNLMMTYLNVAKTSNEKIKSLIDDTFSGEKSVEKTLSSLMGNMEVDNESNKEYNALVKKLYMLSPKISMAIVMNEFKYIRNIIALGKMYARAYENYKKDHPFEININFDFKF